MARAQGCPHVRLLLCLSFAFLLLEGCALSKPPYCPVKPAAVPPVGSGGPQGSLHRKALAYDKFLQATLWPQPFGGVVNLLFETGETPDSLGELIGYDDPQDSADWTGTYLAAQAFRYAVSADPHEKEEALQNAWKAARTLHLFLTVTGRPGLLARFAGPLSDTKTYLQGYHGCSGPTPDQAAKCCVQNQQCVQSTRDPGLFWLGGTTVDQYSGWFFGMGIVHRLIDDPELRQLIRRDMQEIMTVLEAVS